VHLFDELAAVELAHQRLVHRALIEVETS